MGNKTMLKLRPSSNTGLFHDTRGDVQRIARVLKSTQDYVEALEKRVSALEARFGKQEGE